MTKKFTQLLAVLLIFLAQQAQAQDPHFSQFYATPLQMNPAMTGVFDGSFRVVANFREQWSSISSAHPFRTVNASFDMRKHIRGDDYFSFGVSALQDQAGTSLFAQTRGNISLSYMKQLGGSRYSSDSQFLIAGAQFGAGQNSIRPDKLWFSAQFNEALVEVDQNASNMENINNNTNIYLDFNVGLMWYAVFDDDASLYIGGALNHLNSPEVSFYDNGNEILHSRWVGHAGGEVPFSRQLSLLPAVAVTGQGPSLKAMFGGNFRYSNHDWRELAIRAGVWGRLANTERIDGSGSHLDAVIFSAILEMERWNLGFSYDVNASSLQLASQSRGAFEISLVYVHPATRRLRVNCPKF